MHRKEWHSHWIDRCYANALMSTCVSGRRVGAVIVSKHNRSLSDGFNGVPSKFPHPTTCPRKDNNVPSGQCLDMCPCAHAESNAIDTAARYGISIEGAYTYCTNKPCVFCMSRIINSGIEKVYYIEDYPHELTSSMAKYANVELIQLDGTNYENN